MTRPTMEILSVEECTNLLRQVPVGRIAVTVDALPAIFPVNFDVVDGAVVFRTPPGTKLASATASAVVAFEVDSYEADGRTGWSVMVQGMAGEVTDPASLREVDLASLDAWALDGAADHVVRIELHRVSGRRFTN
jgi:nitroimidazol reductase NimA-like FMN-containing flavoprotein (pyridoxamine 5'-phosphate oxidase superfamily)